MFEWGVDWGSKMNFTLTGPHMDLSTVEWMVSAPALPNSTELANLAAFGNTWFMLGSSSAILSPDQVITAAEAGVVVPMQQNNTKMGCVPSIHQLTGSYTSISNWLTWTEL
jgi:hypothetical protein